MATQTMTQQQAPVTAKASTSYLDIAKVAQASVYDAIPAKWRLSKETIAAALPQNGGIKVVDIPRTCGLLTPEQINITEQTATELVARMAGGQLTSVQVTEAFCARAAIAHQLVRFEPVCHLRPSLCLLCVAAFEWNWSKY